MSKRSMWRWVKTDNGRLLDVGILEDGSLHNPNVYPDDEVRCGRPHLCRCARRSASRRIDDSD
jgi:hypothetical protein